MRPTQGYGVNERSTAAFVAVVLAIGLFAPSAISDSHAAEPRPAEVAPRTARLGGSVDRARTPRADDEPSTGDAPATDRVVVRLAGEGGPATARRVAASQDATVVEQVPDLDAFVLDVGDQDAEEVAEVLADDQRVEAAFPDHVHTVLRTPNDPLRAEQPHLDAVRVRAAWDRTLATGVTVAVVDTGVDPAHPDLVGRLLRGHDFVDGDRRPDDENGHGTLVAGVVAANTHNGVGVAGVAWDARILPVRVLDEHGEGYTSDVALGIRWAAEQGAQVINLSLGSDEPSPLLTDAVAFAHARGAVVVAAAGNSGVEERTYPAAIPGVISVAATDVQGRLTDFSTWGDWVTLAAPGFDILSTLPTWTGFEYGWFDGTSAAAPVVAGVAALVRAQSPSLTPAQVASRLRTTARDAGPRGTDPYYGAGVVDAARAVGGPSAPAFPIPVGDANEPDDDAARATPIVPRFECLCVRGTLAPEGDVDWYRYEVTAPVELKVVVGHPAFDPTDARSMFPLVTLHDADLGVLGRSGEDGVFTAYESVTATVEPGTYLVSVRNAWGSTSNGDYAVSIEWKAATTARFGDAVSTRLASWTEGAAFADITGDGQLEALVTASRYNDAANDDRLHVLRRDTAGSWSVPGQRLPISGGVDAGPIVVADLSGDGSDEVFVGGKTGIHRFSREDGRLVAGGLLPGLTGNVLALAVGDLDGDGHLDVVASTQTTGIHVLWQDASGDLTPLRIHAAGGGTRWIDLDVGDVTGGPLPEIVGVNGSRNLQVLSATGERTYAHSTPIGSTKDIWGLNGLAVGDVTGDGRDDVVMSAGGNRPSSEVTVLPGGEGGFGPLRSTPVADIPQTIELADVTADGRLDVVTLHGGWGRLSLLEQGAAGLLPPRETRIPTPSHFNRGALAIGDLDGDGALDLGIATGNSGAVATVPGLVPVVSSPPTETAWMRDVTPVQHATVPASPVFTLDLRRDLDPASITATTVRLVDGRTGSGVTATRSYDAGSRRLTVTPSAPLRANRAYQLRVSGVRDTEGDRLPEPVRRFVTVARDGTAPGPVTGVTAEPRLGQATIRWTKPIDADLDRVVVRRLAGATAPTATSGTFVHEGTGSSVVARGLAAGSDHTFGIFTVDESGNTGPRASVILRGTAATATASASTVTFGTTITLEGQLRRPGTNTAVPSRTVELLVRRQGATKWSRTTSAVTATDGRYRLAHRPSWNAEYRVRFPGEGNFLGSESAIRKVAVRTSVSAKLSATTVARGNAVTLTGKVSPAHAGERVTLQRQVDGTWRNVTTATLSSTSTYTFRPSTATAGTYAYRVVKPADADHAQGVSAKVTLRVT